MIIPADDREVLNRNTFLCEFFSRENFTNRGTSCLSSANKPGPGLRFLLSEDESNGK